MVAVGGMSRWRDFTRVNMNGTRGVSFAYQQMKFWQRGSRHWDF